MLVASACLDHPTGLRRANAMPLYAPKAPIHQAWPMAIGGPRTIF
jgi:hypothetical protein